MSLTFHDYVAGILDMPDVRMVSDPPFYWIRHDFIDGICAAVGLLVALAVSTMTWKYSPTFSHMMQWMSLHWLGSHVAESIYIWVQCDNLLTEKATCPWPTFDAYRGDPFRWLVKGIALAVALVYAVGGGWCWLRRHAPEQQTSG